MAGAGGRTALLQTGFRPFFLLAGLYGVCTLAIWLKILSGGGAAPGGWATVHWHAHELIFGFAAAAIAGFLLTAVPSWTDTPRLCGPPLAGLTLVWLAGRAAVWTASLLPAGLVAGLDLLFLPLLAGAVGWPIFHTRRRRNYPVVGVLLALSVANLAVHLQMLELTRATARPALRAALFLLTLLIAIIAGRIVPLFTSNALRHAGRTAELRPSAALERALVVVLPVAVLLDLTREGGLAAALAQLLAAALLCLRQLQWRGWLCRDQPIVWILHVGHAWLVLGFGLRGWAHWFSGIPPSAALHALSAGAIGTMVLAVMSRVALGHTGRPMVAARTTAVAYLLVIAGGLLRVGAPLATPAAYPRLLLLGGALWSLAYLLFCLHYGPILSRARVDGQPG